MICFCSFGKSTDFIKHCLKSRPAIFTLCLRLGNWNCIENRGRGFPGWQLPNAPISHKRAHSDAWVPRTLVKTTKRKLLPDIFHFLKNGVIMRRSKGKERMWRDGIIVVVIISTTAEDCRLVTWIEICSPWIFGGENQKMCSEAVCHYIHPCITLGEGIF